MASGKINFNNQFLQLQATPRGDHLTIKQQYVKQIGPHYLFVSIQFETDAGFQAYTNLILLPKAPACNIIIPLFTLTFEPITSTCVYMDINNAYLRNGKQLSAGTYRATYSYYFS